jgi:hypothetical protein
MFGLENEMFVGVKWNDIGICRRFWNEKIEKKAM